jgi:hypothetical protein
MSQLRTRVVLVASCVVGLFFCIRVAMLLIPAFFPGPLADSSASVIAWVDANGNGVRDPGEKPLPGVCVYVIPSPSEPAPEQAAEFCKNSDDLWTTDYLGQWPHADDKVGGINFFAGSKCSDLWILTVPPKGYEPSTPSIVNGCQADFGFRESGR